jgi:hypothetical protein
LGAGGGVAGAGGGVATAGFTTVGSVVGSGIDVSGFCFFDGAADDANDIAVTSANRARMWIAPR